MTELLTIYVCPYMGMYPYFYLIMSTECLNYNIFYGTFFIWKHVFDLKLIRFFSVCAQCARKQDSARNLVDVRGPIVCALKKIEKI